FNGQKRNIVITKNSDTSKMGEDKTMSSTRRTTNQYLKDRGTLKRSLGVVAIVALGLGYMTPTVVFDTFGIVSRLSDGVVPLAYVFALVVMIFTAISYGKMVQIFPDAGSAYSYTRKTMGEYPGFFVGWAALLDYLLLPMVNAL